MTAHAKLSASGSHTWLHCPGSIKVLEAYRNTSTFYADEGSAAHELAEHCLTKNQNPFNFENQAAISYPHITMDRELCTSVEFYIDFIATLTGNKYYEQRVDFSDYAPEGFGTADCIIYDELSAKISIVDLKYGKGVRVSAIDNSQLKLYALGALAGYPKHYKIKTVHLYIVQPRLDHIDEFIISVDELYRFGEEVKELAQLALSDNAPRIPGEQQCRWCKHKPVCPELLQLTQDALMNDFDNCAMTPVNKLTDDQINKVLVNAALIKSWLSAVEDYVKDKLENGEPFPGYKLVQGRSNRVWINEKEVVGILSELYPPESLFKQSFLSVAKAEKLLGKNNLKLINANIIKKEGKPTLVHESDNRKSIMVSANDFD